MAYALGLAGALRDHPFVAAYAVTVLMVQSSIPYVPAIIRALKSR